MTYAIWTGALLLAVTKLLDCLTTYRHVGCAAHETNPIGRRLMERLGFGRAIVAVYAISALEVALFAGLALATSWTWLGVLFLAYAGVAATLKVAVAHTNRTGYFNALTRLVLAFLRRMEATRQPSHGPVTNRATVSGYHSRRALRLHAQPRSADEKSGDRRPCPSVQPQVTTTPRSSSKPLRLDQAFNFIRLVRPWQLELRAETLHLALPGIPIGLQSLAATDR